MKYISLLDIPDDIYTVLVIYLSDIDLMNMYNTSKQLRRSILSSMTFREPILKTVSTLRDIENIGNHPLIRLSIPAGHKLLYREIVPYLHNVHTLDLSRVRSLQPPPDVYLFKNIRNLNLSNTCISNVNMLGHIPILDLSGTGVSDVSALGNVHTLNISWTRVEDVSSLGKVHTLNISCTPVSDVSALVNVNTLNISWCNITNISSLANVKVLIRNNSTKRYWSV